MFNRRIGILGAAAILSGCYRVDQSENGRAFRVNTVTGEVDEIVDGRFIRTRTPEQIEQDRLNRSEAERALDARRDWPTITLPIDGGTEIRIATKFDTSLQYVLYANKDLKRPDRMLASLTLMVQDADGFEIGQSSISLSEMVSIIGVSPEVTVGLRHRGRIFISEEEYRNVTGIDISWAGFG